MLKRTSRSSLFGLASRSIRETLLRIGLVAVGACVGAGCGGNSTDGLPASSSGGLGGSATGTGGAGSSSQVAGSAGVLGSTSGGTAGFLAGGTAGNGPVSYAGTTAGGATAIGTRGGESGGAVAGAGGTRASGAGGSLQAGAAGSAGGVTGSAGGAAGSAATSAPLSCTDPSTTTPTHTSVAASGCADGTREGLLDASRFPQIAACAGEWSGTVDQLSAKALCDPSWHVCRGDESVFTHEQTHVAMIRTNDAVAFGGCFAFDAAHDNWACHPGCSASVAAGVDSAENIDMAGLGADCPYHLGGDSCLSCGRIDASENSGTGCSYHSGLTGVVCCINGD